MPDDLRKDIVDAYEKHNQPLRYWSKQGLRRVLHPGIRGLWGAIVGGQPLWQAIMAVAAIIAATGRRAPAA